jgi:hypothetical protein
MPYADVFDIFCVTVWDEDIGIWRGVSKRVEDSTESLLCWRDTPETAVKPL